VQGTLEARASISGAASSPAATGEVRLSAGRAGSWVPGDVRARLALRGRDLKIDALEIPGRDGALVRARGTLRLDRSLRLDAEADLGRVEFAEVLERCGLRGAWVLLRASGKVRVAGTLSPLALTGDAGLDLADFKVLTHSWETFHAPEVPVVELRAARLEGALRISRDSVRIEGARLRAGTETLRTDAELFLSAERGYAVTVDGGADLSLLRHVSSVPVGGRAVVRGTARAAPYGNPRIEAQVRARDLRFLDLDLGEAAAAITYGPGDEHVIHATAIDGRKGVTAYGGSVAVDLDLSPPEVREARLEAKGRLRDLFEAVMPWLPSTRVVRDALDAAVEVEATAQGPATALGADFRARLGAGTALQRPFDSGVVEGRIEDGARAFFRKVEIARAGGTARANGRWELAAPNAWDLEASWAALPLGDVLGSSEAWTGRADGSARIRGSLDMPDVTFTSKAQGASVGGVPLRDARAEGRIEGERMTLRATAEGFRLDGRARLVGDGPFEATAEFDHEDVGRLFHEGGQGARLCVRGTSTATGVIVDVTAARADVALDRVEASYADFRVANEGVVRMAFADKRLAVRPFTMRGTNTTLAVQGEVGRGTVLALDVAGTLDLRILGDSVPRVTRTQGQLGVEARVGGTIAEPVLVGTGRLRDGGFQFKDVPITFAGLAGDLSFSHSRVFFDRLDGAVNGGRAELSGEVELVKLFPERVQIRTGLSEVPLRIPEWLPSVVTGTVTVNGGWDSMDMGGRLHVVRARYTENLDLERSALEFRRRAAVGRPYDPSGEWLRLDVGLVVDGDARVENDVVRGTVRGEVTLTGTLGAPGLVGTLAMTEGSRANFRGNEFALSHAVVDYTDRRAIRMHLDVNGETRIREYQIFMHLFGPYDAPTLQLTSQPALTQEDLVALLSLGFTTRDAGLSGLASGAATAAAAQALFSVSGLDEQVRRFVPRGGPLRDFTVRMTTAYSEGSGQVEPRAEFESKLLDDRLRLRWQAPLSAARGQRAQAELKVGGRASVQYQWENDNPDVATCGDHGLDLKLRWEWND
jgi:translocation and assembly module TamB